MYLDLVVFPEIVSQILHYVPFVKSTQSVHIVTKFCKSKFVLRNFSLKKLMFLIPRLLSIRVPNLIYPQNTKNLK